MQRNADQNAVAACHCSVPASAEVVSHQRRRTLRIVLAINLVMFAAELSAGLWADSQGLIADSADSLGDALVYGMSLLVVGRSLRWRASAAFLRGLIQLAFGIGVVASIVHSLLDQPAPVGLAMIGVAAAALAGNLLCFVLLLRHRGEDVNMRSVWLCSRNDVLGNLAVIVAGSAVMLLDSYWPDIIVATLVAAVFLQTSYTILRDSIHAWHSERSPA